MCTITSKCLYTSFWSVNEYCLTSISSVFLNFYTSSSVHFFFIFEIGYDISEIEVPIFSTIGCPSHAFNWVIENTYSWLPLEELCVRDIIWINSDTRNIFWLVYLFLQEYGISSNFLFLKKSIVDSQLSPQKSKGMWFTGIILPAYSFQRNISTAPPPAWALFWK